MVTALVTSTRRRRLKPPGFLHRLYRDLWMACSLAGIEWALSGLQGTSELLTIIHALVGLVVFVFVPGYVTVAGLFPLQGTLQTVERWGLTITLSAVFYVLVGMALSWLSAPFDSFDLSLAVVFWSLGWSLLAAIRRQSLSPSEVYAVNWSPGPIPILAILVTCAAVFGIYSLHMNNVEDALPSLALTASDGLAVGFPFTESVGESQVYVLRLANPTRKRIPFRVDEILGGRALKAWITPLAPSSSQDYRVVLPTLGLGKQRVEWRAVPLVSGFHTLTVAVWYTVTN